MAFENCHTWVLKQIARRRYDLYLLCNVDIAWTADELREYPELAFRKKLFKMYKDIVVNSSAVWAEVSGTDAQRLQTAVSAVDAVFGKAGRGS